MNSTILVRVFIEASDMEVGKQTAMLVASKLLSFGDVSQQKIRQYWKISEYLEITLGSVLKPFDPPQPSLKRRELSRSKSPFLRGI